MLIMEVLILTTNVRSKEQVNEMTPLFNLHPSISRWHVDINDCDRILKVETHHQLQEDELKGLLKQYGIRCESLPD